MWVESMGEKIEMPVKPGFDRVRIDQIFTPIRPFFSRHHHLGLGHVASQSTPKHRLRPAPQRCAPSQSVRLVTASLVNLSSSEMSTMAMATVSVAAPVRATAGSKAAKPAFMGRAAAGSKASLSDAFCAMSLATPARKQANRSLSICGEYSFDTMDAPERVRTALSGPPWDGAFFRDCKPYDL
jgi:hypothetical protein